jgi:hypothetical protein
MTAEFLVCRLTTVLKVFSQTLRISRAVIGMLIWVVVVGQSLATDERCWPVRNITFQAGSQEEVAKKAADFLIKVEDVPQHPYWPQGTSGVTLGVGWDAGYHSRAELREMWAALGPDVLARLEEAAGKKGRAAQTLIPKLRVIEIPRSVSIQVLTFFGFRTHRPVVWFQGFHVWRNVHSSGNQRANHSPVPLKFTSASGRDTGRSLHAK